MTGRALQFTVRLPSWCEEMLDALPDRLADENERMDIAIELSRRNVDAGTGGPFGALVVVAGSGEVVSAGVNRVEPQRCSSAHAEIVALSLAQARLGTWDLSASDRGPLQLVTSCEPCAMCLGAIPWSGVHSVLCGATKADAERAGFDEGDRPTDWADALERRGIRVVTGLRSASAGEVLADYARRGATIYHP